MYPKRFEHLLAMVAPIHFKTWHTLQKVYFCSRKTCPNSSILCHWRCTASFSHLHLYIPFCMKSNFLCNFTPCISVKVMFLVQHFAFVVKTKFSFVPLIFLPLELKESSCQTFLLMFSLFSAKPESEFSSHKGFFMLFFFVLLYF